MQLDLLTFRRKNSMIYLSLRDGGIIVEMEESSSRIEDPTYPIFKHNKHDTFFSVFFCYSKEDNSCYIQ